MDVDGLGLNISILLDGRDVRVRPQELQVIIGEVSSETVDDVPIVCDLRVAADHAGEGGDTDNVVNVVLQGHDVTSGNRVPATPDQDGGREGSKS